MHNYVTGGIIDRRIVVIIIHVISCLICAVRGRATKCGPAWVRLRRWRRKRGPALFRCRSRWTACDPNRFRCRRWKIKCGPARFWSQRWRCTCIKHQKKHKIICTDWDLKKKWPYPFETDISEAFLKRKSWYFNQFIFDLSVFLPICPHHHWFR